MNDSYYIESISPWKNGWLIDAIDKFYVFNHTGSERIAWGNKPSDVRFVTSGEAIYVIEKQPGRD